MSMCRVLSCVVGRGCLLWPVHSLGLRPASFHIPRPNLPVIPGVSWLPTFAFQFPIMKRTCFLGAPKLHVSFHMYSCVWHACTHTPWLPFSLWKWWASWQPALPHCHGAPGCAGIHGGLTGYLGSLFGSYRRVSTTNFLFWVLQLCSILDNVVFVLYCVE